MSWNSVQHSWRCNWHFSDTIHFLYSSNLPILLLWITDHYFAAEFWKGQNKGLQRCIGSEIESLPFSTQLVNAIKWFLPSLRTSSSVSISDDFNGRIKTNYQRLRDISLSRCFSAAGKFIGSILEITGDFLPFSNQHWKALRIQRGKAQKATSHSDLHTEGLRTGVGYCCTTSPLWEKRVSQLEGLAGLNFASSFYCSLKESVKWFQLWGTQKWLNLNSE